MKRHANPLSFFSALTLLVCACAAQAEGVYVGGGGFLRHYDLTHAGAASKDDATGQSLSAQMFIGYDFNERWAAEGGYVNLGRPSYTYSLNGRETRLSTDGHVWFGAVRATLPLNETFSLYSRLGVSQSRTTLTGSGAAAALTKTTTHTSLMSGLGLQYKINQNLASTVELTRFGPSQTPGSSLTGLSMSLKYGF